MRPFQSALNKASQRKPRSCSPTHFEAFSEHRPKPCASGLLLLHSSAQDFKTSGGGGGKFLELCMTWPPLQHEPNEERASRAGQVANTRQRNAPSPCRAGWPQPPSPQQLLLLKPPLPPWSQPLLPSRLSTPAIFGCSSSCHPYPFLILTRPLHSFLIPAASPHTHKKSDFIKKKNREKNSIWAGNHLI